MAPTDKQPFQSVDILQIRFPRMTKTEALQKLIELTKNNMNAGVAFPDMSTLNQAESNPDFKYLLQSKMIVMNDGAGLAWIAKRLGCPFPANLNGTDLCPALMELLDKDTRIFILGTKPKEIRKAHQALSRRFPHINFVGSRNGYFNIEEEPSIIAKIHKTKPDIVLVGMGNPRQVEFITRFLDSPDIQGTLLLAVGGFLDYWAGNISRAPLLMRRLKLEWLYLIIIQPHKIKRYLIGIPLFTLRCIWADISNQHTYIKPPQNNNE